MFHPHKDTGSKRTGHVTSLSLRAQPPYLDMSVLLCLNFLVCVCFCGEVHAGACVCRGQKTASVSFHTTGTFHLFFATGFLIGLGLKEVR